MKRQIITGHLFTLILGGLIYLSFRQDTLIMFRWLDSIHLSPVISELRSVTLPISEHLPDWFLYSFPDGLWLFSYLSILLVVWDNVVSKHNLPWLLLVPILAIFSEIGQYFNIIYGTFDISDLLFYLGGTVLPFLLYSNPKADKAQIS